MDFHQGKMGKIKCYVTDDPSLFDDIASSFCLKKQSRQFKLTYKLENYLNSLFSLQRRGIKLGLEHTKNLLKFFDNPHEKFLTIHVAGTNGKGINLCIY